MNGRPALNLITGKLYRLTARGMVNGERVAYTLLPGTHSNPSDKGYHVVPVPAEEIVLLVDLDTGVEMGPGTIMAVKILIGETTHFIDRTYLGDL